MARGLAEGGEFPGPADVGGPKGDTVEEIEPVGDPAVAVLLHLFDIRDEADPGVETGETGEMRRDDARTEIGWHEALPVQGQDRQLREHVRRDHEIHVRIPAQDRQGIDAGGAAGQICRDEPDIGEGPRRPAHRPEMHGIHEADRLEGLGQMRERHVLHQAGAEHHGHAPPRQIGAGGDHGGARLFEMGGPGPPAAPGARQEQDALAQVAPMRQGHRGGQQMKQFDQHEGTFKNRVIGNREAPLPLRWGPLPARTRARNLSGATVSNLVRILLAIFLPPVAVLMTNGIGLQFLLNILLTIFFVLPGTIHALWLVLRER